MDDFFGFEAEPFYMDDFEVYNQNEADDYRYDNADFYDDDFYYEDVSEF